MGIQPLAIKEERAETRRSVRLALLFSFYGGGRLPDRSVSRTSTMEGDSMHASMRAFFQCYLNNRAESRCLILTSDSAYAAGRP